MTSQASRPQYPTFYVDDSSCEISGRKHIILAAISLADEENAIAEWLHKKQECGIDAYTEVKWNNKLIPLDQLREFLPLINRGRGIVLIDDSTKQEAAERLCSQISWFCHVEGKNGFRLRFDKDIVESRKELQKHLRGLCPSCVGVSSHDSEYEQLIQYADFLAGAVKLKIDLGMGIRDPNLKILVGSDDPGSKEQMELSFYLFATLRYCLWGYISDYGDGINTYEPRKSVIGRGVVIHSSTSQDVMDKAMSFIDGDYMGCIH